MCVNDLVCVSVRLCVHFLCQCVLVTVSFYVFTYARVLFICISVYAGVCVSRCVWVCKCVCVCVCGALVGVCVCACVCVCVNSICYTIQYVVSCR